MEQLPEYQKIETEKFRSFDVLASVDLYKFDLINYGHILPETKQRVCDEELTYIAEGINRPLYTEFVLQEIEGQLVYFDRGRWKPYLGTLMQGLRVAEAEALEDPRKGFMAERAAQDLKKGYNFLNLKPGESTAWKSAYPEKEEKLYGKKLIIDLGFQPNRKMGFLYHAERRSDGSLVMRTQSVDNSSEEAFSEALKNTSDIISMRNAYDASLSYRNHGEYYAGRRTTETVPEENAWTEINQHKDLLNFYFDQLEVVAQKNIPREDIEIEKKRLTYGVWAAIKERLDRGVVLGSHDNKPTHNELVYDTSRIHLEISQAYRLVANRGEVMPGCGGAIRGEADMLNAPTSDVFDSIFGGKKENGSKESWTWKKGVCRVDDCPTRPGSTKVGPCDVCVSCQHLFDHGKDPAKVYGRGKSRIKV